MIRRICVASNSKVPSGGVAARPASVTFGGRSPCAHAPWARNSVEESSKSPKASGLVRMTSSLLGLLDIGSPGGGAAAAGHPPARLGGHQSPEDRHFVQRS